MFMLLSSVTGSPVLIDTWWNVNGTGAFDYSAEKVRFNRYMVECECYPHIGLYNMNRVLIDTWWNVNFLMSSFFSFAILF